MFLLVKNPCKELYKEENNKLIRYVNIAVYLPKNSKCFLVKVDTYAKNSAESS